MKTIFAAMVALCWATTALGQIDPYGTGNRDPGREPLCLFVTPAECEARREARREARKTVWELIGESLSGAFEDGDTLPDTTGEDEIERDSR